MDEGLVEEWCSSSNTVEGWTEMMNLVTEQANQSIDALTGSPEKLSTENFDKQIVNKVKILNFKTPKTKKKQADESDDDDNSVKTEEPIETTKVYNYNPLPFRSLFQTLDERIRSIRKTLGLLLKWKKTESVFTAKLSSHVDAMFEFLKRSIGSKLKNFSHSFDGPNIWNLLENFATRFSSIDNEIKEKVALETVVLKSTQAALQKQLGIETMDRKFNEKRVEDCLKKLAPRIENGEKFTLSGLEVLKKQIDLLTNKIDDLNAPSALNLNHALSRLYPTSTTATTIQASNKDFTTDIEDLKRTLDDIKSTVRELKVAGDKSSTKFGGLNFSSGPDAKA